MPHLPRKHLENTGTLPQQPISYDFRQSGIYVSQSCGSKKLLHDPSPLISDEFDEDNCSEISGTLFSHVYKAVHPPPATQAIQCTYTHTTAYPRNNNLINERICELLKYSTRNNCHVTCDVPCHVTCELSQCGCHVIRQQPLKTIKCAAGQKNKGEK